MRSFRIRFLSLRVPLEYDVKVVCSIVVSLNGDNIVSFSVANPGWRTDKNRRGRFCLGPTFGFKLTMIEDFHFGEVIGRFIVIEKIDDAGFKYDFFTDYFRFGIRSNSYRPINSCVMAI